MVGRRWQILSVLVALASQPALAQDSAAPFRFWLEQPANTAGPDSRPAVRHPAFRPRRRSAAPPSARSTPLSASQTKPLFVVAVFGDNLAYDLARGLADAYEGEPQAGVVDETGESSGLAQQAAPNWSQAVDDATKTAGHVDAAVLMLGGSDVQALPDGHGGVLDPGSPGWRQAYADKVAQTAAAFRDRKLTPIWVGLPVVRDADLARHFAEINAIVREAATATHTEYVDIWEGFTDENGHYQLSGPDVNGQTAKLRRDDGRRFTAAGSRKLANFVEPALNRILEKVETTAKLAAIVTNDADVFDQALAIDVNAQIRREAGLAPLASDAPSGRDGPVLELTAAPTSPDGRLATASVPLPFAIATQTVLASGLTPPARRGRIDDFAWPRPQSR